MTMSTEDKQEEKIVRWLKDENRLQNWEVVNLESDTKEEKAKVDELSMYELIVDYIKTDKINWDGLSQIEKKYCACSAESSSENEM